MQEVIALMNVYKKNCMYRHLFVNARIYWSSGKILAVVNSYCAGQ